MNNIPKLAKKVEGNTYGLVTVSSPIKYEYRITGKTKHLFVWARCRCGTNKFFYASHLSKGNTKSCGCLRHKPSVLRLPDGEAAQNSVIRAYTSSAKKRNIYWKLTRDEALSIMKMNCHYCNNSPSNLFKSKGNSGNFIYNGIDRKDNAKGYEIGNCVPCCKICNFLKKDMEYSLFLGLIFRIASNRACSNLPSMGELVEKLAIANLKLFEVCSQKDELASGILSPEESVSLAKKDIELCRERAKLKSEINRAFYGRSAIEEVKNYGKD